jgi:hypothetical protein
MTIRVEREQDILAEAIQVLMDHMPLDKVTRVLAAWQIGQGDYTEVRHRLFAGETVESLCARIREFEREQGPAPAAD